MAGVAYRTVAADDADMRLDRWLRQNFTAIGQARIQKLLRKGQVRIDGSRARADARLVPGQVIRIPPELSQLPTTKPPPLPPSLPRKSDAMAELAPLILHQDAAVLALNKPAGLPVQGGTGQNRALDAMLKAAFSGNTTPPRLVHRLDKETSGVLLVALTATAARHLTAAFRTDSLSKLYWALTDGVPDQPQGRIDTAIAKGNALDAKPALTDYQRIDRVGNRLAWLALRPRTGRTHQLRRHCCTLGTPIWGDSKYGRRQEVDLTVPKGLCLHARAIRFPHPAGGKMTLEAPLPSSWRRAFVALGFSEADAGDPFADEAGPP